MKLADEQRYAPPQGPMLEVDERGRRLVQAADDRITLNVEGVNRLLATEGGEPIEVLPDGTIALDSAGEYRYRFIERDRWRPTVDIYQRI